MCHSCHPNHRQPTRLITVSFSYEKLLADRKLKLIFYQCVFNILQVIKTLKHALQPVITDVKVTWDLAAGWTVQQCPASVPPIFLGDRLVLYGLLESAKKMQGSLKGSAKLQCTMEGRQLDHVIEFHVSDVGDKQESMALGESKSLHRLAAKCLIQEKQDKEGEDTVLAEQEKASIISISKSSKVVSKLTSFVAVDRASREPVSGPLQQRRVPLPVSQNLAKLLKSSLFGHLNVPMYGIGQIHVQAREKAKKVGGRAGIYRARKRQSKPQPEMRTKMLACDSLQTSSSSDEQSKEVCSDLVAPMPEAMSSPSVKASSQDTVLMLITLQKASGMWELSDQLATVCGHAISTLLQSCPQNVPQESQLGKSMWATALALGLLAGKFWDRRDEWEMIAGKGKKWLKSNVPEGVNYQDVLQAAASTLVVLAF